MEEHFVCKHLDISGCDHTCECWCDACQDCYEQKWMARAEAENLCKECGLPNVLTPESLVKEERTHFYRPCKDCTERFTECMKLASRCLTCHFYTEGVCKNCLCDESDSCHCWNCRSNAYKY